MIVFYGDVCYIPHKRHDGVGACVSSCCRTVILGESSPIMYSFRSLFLGTILTILYSLVVTCYPAWEWGMLLSVMLLSGGMLVFVVNPLLSRTKRFVPFSVSELVLLACMLLISAAVSGTGLSTRVVQGIATLHNPVWSHSEDGGRWACDSCRRNGVQGVREDCAYCIERTWNAAVEPYLPDRLFVSQPGSREHAQKLQRELDAFARSELEKNLAIEERQKAEGKLQQLFGQYLHQEAACYGCSVEDIAKPRQQRDELQRELILVTRQLNELRTDPNTARSRTLAEAVALNKRLSELYKKKRRCEDDIAKLDERLKSLRKNANAEELLKLAVIKQEIQAVQARISVLSHSENEYVRLAVQQGTQVKYAKMVSDLNKAPVHETLKEYNRGKPQVVTGISDVKSMFRAVPWHLWGLPLAVWGALACVTLVVFHQLSILLHWHWKSLKRPEDFPLMNILGAMHLLKPGGNQQVPDIVDTDDGQVRRGFLRNRPMCVVVMVAVFMLVMFFMCRQVSFRIPFLAETRLFPFTLSLAAFSVAMLLPLRLTVPCLGMQAIVMVVAASMSLCQPGGDWSAVVHELEKRLFSGSGAFVGCALGMVFFLVCQARSTLLCCLHPYDIPNARRKERHDLVRASAISILALLVLGAMQLAFLGVDLSVALFGCFLLALLVVFSAYLACETGLPYLGQPVALQSMLCSFPASFVPTSLYLFLFAFPFRSVPLFAHGIHLRNCFRLKRGIYQAGVTLAVVVSVCCTVIAYLMLAYGGRLPVEYQEASGATAMLFDGFALHTDSLSLPVLFVGALVGCTAMACCKGGTSGMALCLIAPLFPSLFSFWFSLLSGCITSVLAHRFLSTERNRQVRLGCFAVAVVSVLFTL